LQGKVRNIYKQESVLKTLLESFCRNHPYQVKFNKVIKSELSRQSQGNKIKYRKLAVKIIRRLDHQMDGVRRSDLLQDMLVENYKDTEVDKMLKILHNASLIVSNRGGHSYVEMVTD